MIEWCGLAFEFDGKMWLPKPVQPQQAHAWVAGGLPDTLNALCGLPVKFVPCIDPNPLGHLLGERTGMVDLAPSLN